MSTVTEQNNEVITNVTDTVCYSPGKKETESAFFIDPKYFDATRGDEDEPEWKFRILKSSGWIVGRFAECSYSDNKAEISFESKQSEKTKKIIEVFVKSYEEASMLYHRGLPEISPDVG